MSATTTLREKLTAPTCAVGFFAFLLLMGCASMKTGLSGSEVIDKIANNECAASQLQETPLLVGLWRNGEVSYVHYPDSLSSRLKPTTDVQLGGLTASFLVPRLTEELHAANLTLDSTAIVVRSPTGSPIRNITFAQLILHVSDLPSYDPGPDGSTLDHLLALNSLLSKQDQALVRGRYRFDHWNYTLAAEALSSRVGLKDDFRHPQLAYSDALPDSILQNLAASSAKVTAPRERQRPDLFALSTAGVASAEQLVRLVDSLSNTDLAQLPSSPTLPNRKNTAAVPGWYRIVLRDGRPFYLNSGMTRRYGAAVAYFPDTKTGVVAVAADSKRLDCLAVDILRNFNNDWKDTGHGQEE